MMFALAVLDLPFEAGKHDVAVRRPQDDAHARRAPTSSFHEEVSPADGSGGQASPILVSQNFYRHGDRFREENGEQLDKFVTGEFVVHTVYGCQVVRHQPDLVAAEADRAAADPGRGDPGAERPVRPRSVPLDLEPYRTQTLDYFFYFPAPGKFAHFPVHVAKNEQLVAAAAAGHVQRRRASRAKLDTDVVGLRLAARHRRAGAGVPRPRERRRA